MKAYPQRTGALCANSHPGSYTGQDAFNDMLPVIEVEQDDMVLHRQWPDAQCLHAGGSEHIGHHARCSDSGTCKNLHQFDGGGGTAATLTESYYKGTGTRNGEEREYLARENEDAGNGRKYVLRRLTPVECARLQGFPDWWCDGADGSDSAQYKMWGNGIALPCATDVLGRIALAAEKND